MPLALCLDAFVWSSCPDLQPCLCGTIVSKALPTLHLGFIHPPPPPPVSPVFAPLHGRMRATTPWIFFAGFFPLHPGVVGRIAPMTSQLDGCLAGARRGSAFGASQQGERRGGSTRGAITNDKDTPYTHTHSCSVLSLLFFGLNQSGRVDE